MADEWGPWIEHDGKGRPVPVGTYVRIVGEGEPGVFFEDEARIQEGKGLSWDWRYWGEWISEDGQSGCVARVIRYKIRKPKGLLILEGILENLPVREDA